MPPPQPDKFIFTPPATSAQIDDAFRHLVGHYRTPLFIRDISVSHRLQASFLCRDASLAKPRRCRAFRKMPHTMNTRACLLDNEIMTKSQELGG